MVLLSFSVFAIKLHFMSNLSFSPKNTYSLTGFFFRTCRRFICWYFSYYFSVSFIHETKLLKENSKDLLNGQNGQMNEKKKKGMETIDSRKEKKEIVVIIKQNRKENEGL